MYKLTLIFLLILNIKSTARKSLFGWFNSAVAERSGKEREQLLELCTIYLMYIMFSKPKLKQHS